MVHSRIYQILQSNTPALHIQGSIAACSYLAIGRGRRWSHGCTLDVQPWKMKSIVNSTITPQCGRYSYIWLFLNHAGSINMFCRKENGKDEKVPDISVSWFFFCERFLDQNRNQSKTINGRFFDQTRQLFRSKLKLFKTDCFFFLRLHHLLLLHLHDPRAALGMWPVPVVELIGLEIGVLSGVSNGIPKNGIVSGTCSGSLLLRTWWPWV